MKCNQFALYIFILLIVSSISYGWQDDINVNLRAPFTQFSKGEGFNFLGAAIAEIRLGRYLVGSKNHGFRGGAEGDVSLINFGPDVLWHMGLNMETLADDQNDISFRLVQVYYQALMGIKWRLGDGAFHFGYRHRCNHGTDQAETSRITIRSGFTASYHKAWQGSSFQFGLEPGVNIYILGQNRDLMSQPKGNGFFVMHASWPIIEPVSLIIGCGANLELVGHGYKEVYLISDKLSRWWIEPLFAGRLAMRVERGHIKSDFALHFAQNLDTGLKSTAQKTSNLSFDVDFLW